MRSGLGIFAQVISSDKALAKDVTSNSNFDHFYFDYE